MADIGLLAQIASFAYPWHHMHVRIVWDRPLCEIKWNVAWEGGDHKNMEKKY